MKSSLIILTATALLGSNLAFATTKLPEPPKHDAAFDHAISECMSLAGIEKPNFSHAAKDKTHLSATKGTSHKDTKGTQHKDDKELGQKDDKKDFAKFHPHSKDGKKHGKPHHQMSDSQRQQVDSCMHKKGFAKPDSTQKPAHKPVHKIS